MKKLVKYGGLALLALIVLAIAFGGEDETPAVAATATTEAVVEVPDVVGERLSVAESLLDGYEIEVFDDHADRTVLNSSNWVVVSQEQTGDLIVLGVEQPDDGVTTTTTEAPTTTAAASKSLLLDYWSQYGCDSLSCILEVPGPNLIRDIVSSSGDIVITVDGVVSEADAIWACENVGALLFPGEKPPWTEVHDGTGNQILAHSKVFSDRFECRGT